jgi:V8-like Glu-specific endopeptidase
MHIYGKSLSSTLALCATAFAVAALPAPANAQLKRSVSGTSKGLKWEAANMIVGVNSTATAAGGGDPIYFANKPQYSGVATLIIEYADGGAFICTGSLANSTRIVTAAHCVSDGFGTKGPAKVTAFFSDSTDPELVRFQVVNGQFVAAPGAVAVDVGYIHVNPGYTGEVIDQNDIAVLELKQAAPAFAQAYKFNWGDDLAGEVFNIVGNGARSDVGGDIGENLGPGRMRQGENIYDYSWGDSIFGGFFTDIVDGENFFGTAQIADSWVSDFDNFSPAIVGNQLLVGNDTGCILSAFAFGSLKGCSPFLGDIEVGVAGGDSGGPQFVNGLITSVSSYGLTFGPNFGDISCPPNPTPPPATLCLNSSFGEFSGYVPVYLHRQFLLGAIPEPASWAMMIAGFGLVGGSLRRRRALEA